MTKYVFIADTTCDNQPLSMVIREMDGTEDYDTFTQDFVAAIFEANGDCDHVRFMRVDDCTMYDWSEFDVIYRAEEEDE